MSQHPGARPIRPRNVASPLADPCIHLLDPSSCTMCNGRDAAEAKRARVVLSRWPARYSSRLDCGHSPDIGDLIARLANGNIVCPDCTP